MTAIDVLSVGCIAFGYACFAIAFIESRRRQREAKTAQIIRRSQGGVE